MSTSEDDRKQLDALHRDLLEIYARCGREVKYTTYKNERKPYWPHRFRQAVERASGADDTVAFVERLVRAPEPSRGFGYLAAENRLDLSVEALVRDPERPYHVPFSSEAVEASVARLEDPSIHLHKREPSSPVKPSGQPVQSGKDPLDVRVRMSANGSFEITANGERREVANGIAALREIADLVDEATSR